MSCKKLSNNNNTLKHACIVSNAPVANWLLLPNIWNQISNKIIIPETKGKMVVNVCKWLENKNMPTCGISREGHVTNLGSSYTILVLALFIVFFHIVTYEWELGIFLDSHCTKHKHTLVAYIYIYILTNNSNDDDRCYTLYKDC